MRVRSLPLIASALAAALCVSGAAVSARAQKKATERPATPTAEAQADKAARGGAAAVKAVAADAARYRYEFTNEAFHVRSIRILHDAAGRGSITFERKGSDEAITEPLELSEAAWGRINSHWEALRFLDSQTDYQADKQFAHMGTVRLSMAAGARQRTAEFNYSRDPAARGLADEYRRAADQAIAVFDINLARENQPLETPKLLDYLGRLIDRGAASDARQLLPLLTDLSTDERLPLIARNIATRILKKLDKNKK